MEESINKETERYIGLMHALAGAIFGVISGLTLGNGQITFLSTILLGLIASYPLMLISRKIFNLSEK